MRGSTGAGGRFDIPHEQKAIARGIDFDMRQPVGQTVEWIEFDAEASSADAIYDVADQVVGRQWKDPFKIPVYMAVIQQGVTMHNDRGFYNTDVLRLSASIDRMMDVFPELVWEPDAHIKDRILYRGKVFVPTRINMRGLLLDRHTVFSIDANQVNPEEYVNDPQLYAWATRDESPQPYDPQRSSERSSIW